MAIQIIPKEEQAYGAFNGGEIIENKPLGFPQDGGDVRPYSNLFYWANAIAKTDSTIGLHPHKGFEIMSFVLEGNIRHFDTKLREWKSLSEGDVQIIRAGSGISHAEHLEEGGRIFQIWFDPDLSKTMQQEATYDDYKKETFQEVMEDGILKVKYVGPSAPIAMDTQHISISKWTINDYNSRVNVVENNVLSIYVLEGNVRVNDQAVSEDGFIVAKDVFDFTLSGSGTLFVIESDQNPGYETYAQLMQSSMRK